jgi:large repetitive protein
MEHKIFKVAVGIVVSLPMLASAITSGSTDSSPRPSAAVTSWGASSVASQAQGFCLDAAGNAYVLEASPTSGSITEVTASGTSTPVDANDAGLANASAIACGSSTSSLYVGSTSGDISTIPMAGGSLASYSTGNAFQVGGLVASSNGALYVAASDQGALYEVALGGGMATNLGVAGLASNGLHAMALSGDNIYVASATTNQLFEAPLTGGTATLVSTQSLDEPTGMAFDPGGNLWVANLNSNDFVVVEAGLGTSVTVQPSGTLLQGPGGLAWNGSSFVTENINESNQPLVQVAITNVATSPTSPIATSSSPSTATVSWSAPRWNGNAAPLSYRATAEPSGASCQSTSTSCTISGLSGSTTYSISVQALNNAGAGPSSLVISVTTSASVLVATGFEATTLVIVASLAILLGAATMAWTTKSVRRVR